MKTIKNKKPFNAEPTEMAACIRVAIANDEMAESKPDNVRPITQKSAGEVLPDSTGERMSHIEIAKIAKKRSDSVKRTIERLVEQGVFPAPQIVDLKIPQENGRISTVKQLMLKRLDSMVVMASVDGKYCADLVMRWDALESGRLKPTLEQQPVIQQHYDEPEPPADKYTLLTKNLKASQECKALAESWGFEGNQALVIADRLVKAQTGFSPLEAMGEKALLAPVQEMTYTPTELGKFYTPAYSPVTMNQMLQQAGMQERIKDRWTPTDKGKEFSEILDVGKAHSDGTPIKQVKWYRGVTEHLLPVVSQSPADMYDDAPADKGGTGGTEQGANSAPADPMPEVKNPIQEQAEEVTGKPKKRSQVGRYGLEGLHTIMELAEIVGLYRREVVEILLEKGIVEKTTVGNRWTLTEAGWEYGEMYNPSRRKFLNREVDSVRSANYQPVFNDDVIDLF